MHSKGTIPRVCEICGVPFFAIAYRVSIGRARFCSTACRGKFTSSQAETRPPCICEVCGVSFSAKPARIKRGRVRFCSFACMGVASRGRDRSEGRTISVRLWEKVNKDGPTIGAYPEFGPCWDWTGANTMGYGSIGISGAATNVTHRVAWELATGETLTSDDVIGHICDRRKCVRNDAVGTYTVDGILLPRRGHLFKGTHTTNIRDMYVKGRDMWTKRKNA